MMESRKILVIVKEDVDNGGSFQEIRKIRNTLAQDSAS
jgi:hypothetical protein